jgi:MFS family permease
MRRYLRLLRNRPFAALWAGSTVSAVGDAMTWVAIAWLGFERGGAGLVAALVVVSTAPVIVGGLAMGVALDRFERRRCSSP